MIRHVNRLAAWQKTSVDGVGSLLLATGVLWLAVHYSIGAGSGELPHPAEVWAIRVHGLLAFAGLYLLGLLSASHIPRGWHLTSRQRHRAQRGTGAALCALGAVLALSGYLLYYFAPDVVRPALGWLHAGAGVAMAVALTLHRRTTRRAPSLT